MTCTFEAVNTAYSDYCFAIDGNDPEGVANCFAPDGVFEISGRGTFAGRDAIRDVIAATADARPRHQYLNLGIVSSSADEVRSRAYFMLLHPETGAVDAYGHYEDLLVPLGDDRLGFKHRQVNFQWVSEHYGSRGRAAVSDH